MRDFWGDRKGRGGPNLPEYIPPPPLSGPQAVKVRDGGCRISGYINGVELAHLIPAKEKEWVVSTKCRSRINLALIWQKLVEMELGWT